LAHFQVERVQPHVGVGRLERALAEPGDDLVQLAAEARDGALVDSRQAQSLDQLVDLARAHALEVGLLDHRHQRPLGLPPGFQQRREVRAFAQLGDAQRDVAHPRAPRALAVAVAVGRAPLAALVPAGARLLAHLDLHEQLAHHPDRLAQEIRLQAQPHLAQVVEQCDTRIGHRCLLRGSVWFSTRKRR
jgi:hypothetical protein